MASTRASPEREPSFRAATLEDALGVARLHAESWQRHYRGAYSDAFLDGDVLVDRVAVWSERLDKRDPRRFTLLAEDASGLVGFANASFEEDPLWGALLDNLHVRHGHQRRGVGRRLLALTAQAVIERSGRGGPVPWCSSRTITRRPSMRPAARNASGANSYRRRAGSLRG